ncbi:trypsin-like serine peptidase [Streptomyces sp. HUAS TT20]|uniref:trypsin-like serine peptidase n=1 Tax=Streptomyces sp. HUAS TT20 TaxID=3447509 RepID=UPI0021D93462|nr:FG-GAP-like repeat-containing protein [Streptomyces sp. HUAS 15-9]UXY25218.1 FG-GAP-like repeat-containing protein [Streptomyces sp. HUAS 15-9]
MAAALPEGPKPQQPSGTTARSGVNAGGLNAVHFGGVRTVGTFFSVAQDLRGRFCSASIIDSPGKNIILTAGHCSFGSKGVFVPKYDGAARNKAPYGMFPVQRWFRDNRYIKNTKGPYSDLDFAFARVGANSQHKQVQQAVGAALKLGSIGGQFRQSVTVIGYPGGSHNPQNRPIICPGSAGQRLTTSRLAGYQQMRMECGGFWAGTSGSPWIKGFNSATGTGTVIGNLGGWNGGGLEGGPNVDRISYAATYGKRAFEIFDDAKHNRTPREYHRDYSIQQNGGSTWVHAKLMATGDYTGDGNADMIVVWSDGEVTLYRGNGRGGFSGETQLAAPNTTWANARAITGGDFSGGNLADLIVVWVDGEVTLYKDVSPVSKFSTEIQMEKPNATWKNANQITAGRYTGNQWTDDVIVRWSDGELTLYTDVDGRGFLDEHQLKKPNDTWEHATILTAGNYAQGANWDVIVRWSDGELSLYTDTSTNGIGSEHQMLKPNALWQHAAVMTGGSYTGNGRPDDLLVRWSDGEVSLFTDTTTVVGKEHQLVPPKVH